MPALARICCYKEGFEDFGIFIGCLLANKHGKKELVLKSTDFARELNSEIELFRANYDNTPENLQKYFNR